MILEERILEALKDIFDPEIPVNIYDLGLIYEVNVDEKFTVDIKMTLTAPNCPMADELLNEIFVKVSMVDGVKNVKIDLTFDPPWSKDMMSEEAMLELGFL